MQHLLAAELVLRGGVALCEFERLKRVDVVARVPEVVAVQVHRVREAEVFVRLDETLHDLRRGGDVEVGNRVVDVDTVQSPPSPPCLGAAGVDDLDAEPAGCPEKPGGVRGVVLDLVVLQVLEGEPVVSEDRHRGVIDDRGIADLLVDVWGGVERGGHRRLVDEDVAHPRVVVAGLERRGGDGEAHLHAAARRGGFVGGALEELVLRPEEPADVHLRPDDVGVDIHAARHHGHAGASIVFGLERVPGSTILPSLTPISMRSPLIPLQGGVEDEPVLDQ